MTRARRHVAIVWLAVGLAPSAATAADEEVPRGLRFDETAVSTTADKLKGGVTVTVLNDTAKPLLGRLRLSDLGLKSKDTPPRGVSTAATVQFPPLAFDVPAAGERKLRLRAPELDVADGIYKGRLSVFNERTGSVARIPFTLQVGEGEAAAMPAVESVTGDAKLGDLRGGDTTIAVPLDVRKGTPALKAGDPVGILAGDEGGSAEVSFADGEVRSVNSAVKETDLKVDGFDGPGTYKGKLDLAPDADGGEVSVSVETEHWWLWPTLALLVGIALALWLRRLTGAVRPGLVLLADETQAQQAYEKAREAFQEAAKGKPWAAYDTKEAFQHEAGDVRAGLEALVTDSFDQIDQDRKAALLARVDRLESHAATLTALSSALASLQEALGRVKELGAIDGVPGAPVPPLFASAAEALLEGRKVATLAELDTLATSVQQATVAAVAWPLLHADAKRAAGRIDAAERRVEPDGDDADFVATARRKLVGAWLLLCETADADQITLGPLVDELREAVRLAAEATALGAVQVTPPAPLGSATRGDAATAMGEMIRLPWLGGVTDLPAESFARLRKFGVTDLPAGSFARLREITRRIRLADSLQMAFAAAVALYTGLTALYWDKTFGTPTDYVAALLWGSVTAGVLDALAEAIRARVAPLLPGGGA